MVFGLVFFVAGRNEEAPKNENNENKEAVTVVPRDDSGEVAGDLSSEFIQCLADEDVVIYGSRTCPACSELADSFGGYEAISSVYVECSEERERCAKEAETGYVPEIRIKSELYEGPRTPQGLAEETGCQL